LTFAPDSALLIDAATGNTGAGTDGELTNNSVFLEVLAPLWDNGTQNIYLKGGLRYDDWNAFDGDLTWQLGLELQALDSLKLRGTAGTVFRVPTIWDLFGGLVDGFPSASDPCAVAAGESLPPGCDRHSPAFTGGQFLARFGGNPDLVPETGDTLTTGLVWTPQFGDHGFTATVDYWQIDLEDGISSLGIQYILDACYYDLDQNACALITRGPDYSITQIINTQLNVGEQGARGVDTEIRWDYSSNIGQWQAALLWAHLLERTKTAFPGDPVQDLSGRYTDPTAEDGGAYPSDKLNFSLQWTLNDFSVGWLMEYIGALDADTWCNCDSDGDPSNNLPDGTYIQDIDSFLYHDLVASWVWGAANTTVSVGLTNITNKAPPYIDMGFNATTDPSTYRLFGRGYYLRLSWKY
jgi:outer membrane receptor protein involved in Fe transport